MRGPWLALFLLFPLTAEAQDATVPVPADPSAPPPIDDDAFEWVRLVSGEWLKGEFKYLRDDSLTFSSDKLPDQTIDWADVAFAWLPRDHIWTIEEGGRFLNRSGTIVRGSGVILEDRVMIAGPDGAVSFGREELASVVGGGSRELSLWSAYVSLGFDGRWGNSRQFTLTAGAGVAREDGRTRWKLDYNGSYGTSSDVLSIDNHRLATEFDVYVTKEFYVIPVFGEAYVDEFQNIAPRVTLGTGVGGRWKPAKHLILRATLGAAYQYVRYISVEVGEEPEFHGVGAIVGGAWEWDVTGDIDLDATWRTILILNQIGKTSHHGTLMFDHEIVTDIEYNLGVVYDRTEQPQAAADGTPLKKDDVQVVVGFTLKF